MRTKFLYAWAMAFAVCTFVGCSDDDKPLIPPTDLNTTFGTDDKTQLTLNYSDTPLTGKQVKFETTDSRTATITLLDVIPGEAQTVISNVELVENNDEYTFTGNTSTTTRAVASVEYSGSVKKGVLTLNLKVTMANAGAWAKTYGLQGLEKGDVEAWNVLLGQLKKTTKTSFALSPCYSVVEMKEPPKGDKQLSNVTATYNLSHTTLRPAIGCVLLQVLNSVTLEADGNITAKYSSNSIDFQPAWAAMADVVVTPEVIASLTEGRTWEQSPKNLAYWFEKEGKLYIKLNISAIIAQSMADGGDEALAGVINGMLDSDVVSIKKLLGQLATMEGMELIGMLANLSDSTLGMLLDWIKNGIPLNVKVESGNTHIYLDREVLTPIVAELPAFIPVIKELNPMGMGGMLGIILQKLSDSWTWNTKFDLGLDLVTK